MTNADDTITLTGIAGGTADFYWATPASTAAHAHYRSGTTTVVRVSDADSKTLVIGGVRHHWTPLIVRYDGNDQFAVGESGSEALTDLAAFEAAAG